jgi:hypothetical protein
MAELSRQVNFISTSVVYIHQWLLGVKFDLVPIVEVLRHRDT